MLLVLALCLPLFVDGETYTAIKWREDFLSQSIPVEDKIGKIIVRQAKTNEESIHMIMRRNTTILATSAWDKTECLLSLEEYNYSTVLNEDVKLNTSDHSMWDTAVFEFSANTLKFYWNDVNIQEWSLQTDLQSEVNVLEFRSMAWPEVAMEVSIVSALEEKIIRAEESEVDYNRAEEVAGSSAATMAISAMSVVLILLLV